MPSSSCWRQMKSRSLKLDLRSRNALRPMAGRGDSRIFQVQRMFPGKVIERESAFREKILGLLEVSRLQGRGFCRRLNDEAGYNR